MNNYYNTNTEEQSTDTKVSFRGEPIPEVIPKSNFTEVNSKEIIEKIKNMTIEEKDKVTLEAVHYEDSGISNVKLSTGDVVSIETAIALAENRMLNGYTTGATFKGGKVLRSLPDQSNKYVSRIHDLPVF